MRIKKHTPELITTPSLRTFFRESVHQALCNQRMDVQEDTSAYIVNLLTRFSRTENLFEYTREGWTLRPLAGLYAMAVEAPSVRERRAVLQRLGDVALFVAGLFSGMLQRKPVDVGYYVAMGGSAYGYLYDTREQNTRDRALASTFQELSEGFHRFVMLLEAIGERAGPNQDRDTLDLYAAWLENGDPRLESRLRALGVSPERLARPQ